MQWDKAGRLLVKRLTEHPTSIFCVLVVFLS